MHEYVTNQFRIAAAIAAGISRAEGVDTITADHLLAGIMRNRTNNAFYLIDAISEELPAFRQACDRFAAGFPEPSTPHKQQTTEEFKAVILTAIEVARQLGWKYVGTDHLLIGAFQSMVAPARQIAVQTGAECESISAIACKRAVSLFRGTTLED